MLGSFLEGDLLWDNFTVYTLLLQQKKSAAFNLLEGNNLHICSNVVYISRGPKPAFWISPPSPAPSSPTTSRPSETERRTVSELQSLLFLKCYNIILVSKELTVTCHANIFFGGFFS